MIPGMEKQEDVQTETREFICYKCNLKAKVDYFGKQPPFAKSMRLTEDTYIMRDPFSSDTGMISLGSHCALCTKSICASPECSIFYTKRFCVQCAVENALEFPSEIQQELRKRTAPKR